VSTKPNKIYLADRRAAVRATVERSKDLISSANRELDRHQQWFERHRELYREALEGFEHELKRLGLIGACRQTAKFRAHLVSSVCVALLHGAKRVLTNPHRFRMRVKLQNRINALDQLSWRRLLQEVPRGTVTPPAVKPMQRYARSGDFSALPHHRNTGDIQECFSPTEPAKSVRGSRKAAKCPSGRR
jgi:hypothetical protein